jgi:hypothetical protein
LAFATTFPGGTESLCTKERPVPELRLWTRLEPAGKVLVLHYGVENQTMRDAYLLNRVHDHSLRTNPDFVYIELDRARRIVRTCKDVPAIPAGMNPTMPAAPYVTPLRAGQNFTETIQIALPVREFSAYVSVPENGRTEQYGGLTFTLGYYWSLPGMKEHAQEIVPGVEVLIPTPPPGTRVEFGKLSSGVMLLDIPVFESV